MRTQWTTKGNRDAGSSCSCDRGLHRYLRNFGGVWTPQTTPLSTPLLAASYIFINSTSFNVYMYPEDSLFWDVTNDTASHLNPQQHRCITSNRRSLRDMPDLMHDINYITKCKCTTKQKPKTSSRATPQTPNLHLPVLQQISTSPLAPILS